MLTTLLLLRLFASSNITLSSPFSAALRLVLAKCPFADVFPGVGGGIFLVSTIFVLFEFALVLSAALAGLVRAMSQVPPQPLLPIDMSKKHSTLLPFSGGLRPNGSRDVVYLDVYVSAALILLDLLIFIRRSGQKKSTLKDWCREFRLPCGGNMSVLTERLTSFSGNQEAWDQ